jgi:hypothetical protein
MKTRSCIKTAVPAVVASALLVAGAAAHAADAITAANLAKYMPGISQGYAFVDSGNSFPFDNGLGIVEQPGQPSTILGRQTVSVTRTVWPSIGIPVLEDQPPIPPGFGELSSIPIVGLPLNILHHMEAGYIARQGSLLPLIPARPGAFQIAAVYGDPGLIQETASGVVRPFLDPIVGTVEGVIDGIKTTLDTFTGGLCRLKYNLPTKVRDSSGNLLKGRELGFECGGQGAGYGLVVGFGGLPHKSLAFTFSSFQDKKLMYDTARDTRMWYACTDIMGNDVCKESRD